jgi:Zn finger protein HypA/HybF involved in hydrogenase expression
MHDLHEANKIFNLVLAYAKKNNLKKVKKITLKLGSVMEHGEEINADNLKFNIEMLARGSMAEAAVIVIEKAKILGWELVEIAGD